ncbi:minor teichoic acid biosynthesis protein GgaB [Lachnospiraceae bacterium KM106-2]|nr:minor teichoic acid biosynthesis protein GgaB [Lachnospiraceae bacterium KM106-2]
MNPDILIKEYRIEQKDLSIIGIQWPKNCGDTATLVIRNSESAELIEIPVEKSESIQVVLPESLFHGQDEGDSSFSFRCMVEGSEKEYQIRNKSKKASSRNYLLSSKTNAPNKFLIHSRNKGYLQLRKGSLHDLLSNCVIAYVTAFKMRKSKISLEVKTDLIEGQLQDVCIVFRDDEEKKYSFPVVATKKEKNLTVFTSEINLKDISFEQYYWDFYVRVRDQETGKLAMIRMKVDSIPVRKHLCKTLVGNTYGDGEYIAFPYMTNAFNLSIQYRFKHEYDKIHYKIKETVAVWTYKLFKKWFDKKSRWLICEKFANTAQDNSYYFFQYCCDQAKRNDVYYIIKKDSPDYKKLKAYGKRIIPFMSFRHLIYLQSNCKLISSETRIHFFPWKIGRGRIRLVSYNKPYIFLQHGVLGFKQVHNLSKQSLNAADLFITSSEFEKGIVKDNMGYCDDDIAVTGLPRWDALIDKSGDKKRIVLMPTWRLWLEGLTNEEFRQTEYFHKYLNLIRNPELVSLLKKYDAKLTFIIHPKIHEYMKEFVADNDLIEIYEFGEVPINEKLMESSLMITDYSSVAWDMYYMHKPIIFYKFDLEQLEETQGSYIDPRSEVIGDIVYSEKDLLKQIEEYMVTSYREKRKYAESRTTYLAYDDKNNSRRIYDEICKKMSSNEKCNCKE